MLILNVYLPYYSDDNYPSYLIYLGKIELVIAEQEIDGISIVGDFNADIDKVYYNNLIQVCDGRGLVISDVCMVPRNSYTHVNNATLSRSWLDHCITSQTIHDVISHILNDNTYHGSDHFPLHMQFTLKAQPRLVSEDGSILDAIDWKFKDNQKVDSFSEHLTNEIRNLHLWESLSSNGLC